MKETNSAMDVLAPWNCTPETPQQRQSTLLLRQIFELLDQQYFLKRIHLQKKLPLYQKILWHHKFLNHIQLNLCDHYLDLTFVFQF